MGDEVLGLLSLDALACSAHLQAVSLKAQSQTCPEEEQTKHSKSMALALT